MSKNVDIADDASCFIPEYKSSCIDENKTMEGGNVSGMNLPEKILFVIDTTREKDCTPFKLSTGPSYMPLSMIKRIVENFIYIKSMIQRNHEYAVMILNSHSAQWICDFTNNTNCIVNHLNSIIDDFIEEDQNSYDFGQLFEKIEEKLPRTTVNVVPAFVTRVILVYSRSNSIPKFHSSKRALDSLTKNPYFFMDVLYVHEPPCPENVCEQVYSEIATLDTTSFSYILEVGRNAAKLHNSMAILLAHPLQRPPQSDASYLICPSSESQEASSNV